MKNLILTFALTSLLSACASTQQSQKDRLFQELGGHIGIDELVVTSIQFLHNDERIAFLFEDIDEPNLVTQLNEQLCSISGGPCQYQGLSMLDAHAGMDLSKAEFDIFVEVFIEAMRARNIPFSTQNELLALLAPMRVDIIHQ